LVAVAILFATASVTPASARTTLFLSSASLWCEMRKKAGVNWHFLHFAPLFL